VNGINLARLSSVQLSEQHFRVFGIVIHQQGSERVLVHPLHPGDLITWLDFSMTRAGGQLAGLALDKGLLPIAGCLCSN
jgi:hypothetical protein